MNSTPAAGENIAVLRKVHGVGQVPMARAMGISRSYLQKLEYGERPVTPPLAAAAATKLGVRVARIWGQLFTVPTTEHTQLLDALREVLRRHTLPREDVPSLDELDATLKKAAKLRAETRYVELLQMLPTALGQAMATALTAGGDAVAWGQVADLYGCAYAVAHRMGEPDRADMIVSRQAWASHQTWNPTAEAATAWNEAGTFQSAGQYDDSLAIVERAIIRYEEASGSDTGPERLVVLGSLHLRGVVLASCHRDRDATDAHLQHAKRIAAELGEKDILRHNLTFGPGNTALVRASGPHRAL
ncbi:helix-turn-helix domain-containing protein [Streptomyces spectabilis]|uniref:Transcriptional regulator with XRE-family HTH domain n=1 Tax=Streptomyces spectabilis TaxID=68270 RepID=A0A7W8B751_STRST|nr:helix-turn-helix transcriptional regulator [Streptomyces spectabilis]MBB5109793.1 transcriptional regulator with XRE-family HTH domain [Streptomyces spectabilis]GGV55604.1 hypothetical protein GCM10010245_88210 [Streptomyces spectabilis]